MSDQDKLQAFIDHLEDEEKNRLLFHLLAKRESDGLNGRTWDAGRHLHHETHVSRELARIAAQGD